MSLESIGDFILNNGIGIVVVIYFLWKDSKLTKENSAILYEVKALLQLLVGKEIKGGEKNE